mgnify:CR=1 FL=1
MDVKRIESVAIPTTLAAAGAGTMGYFLPRAITKSGEASFPLLASTAIDMYAKDEKLMREADTLDRFIKSDELIRDAIDRHQYGSHTFRPAAKPELPYVLPTQENIDKLRGISEGLDRKELLEEINRRFAQPTEEETQKFLEKFVRRHAKELGVEPKESQTLAEAAKEYVKGKTAAEIKEVFLPASVRRIMEKSDYIEILDNTFRESYDKAKKEFKPDEVSQAAKKMFKAAERNMRLKVAGTLAAVVGGVALASSLLTNAISSKK